MKTNKKIYKLLGVVFLNILFFTSCNEETVNIDEDASTINGLKVISYNNKNNVKSKGMAINSTTIAVFSNEEAHMNYTKNLEDQVADWDDNFLSQWGHLNDEALNAKEDELNFDSEKPLTDFENQIGLQSLRQRYLSAESEWLNNDVLDEANDPDNNPIYDFDESEMAVLNILSEVQIGTTIYKKLSLEQIDEINNTPQKASYKKIAEPLENGAYLEIENEDYDTLIEFNDGNTSVVDNDNVTVNNSSSTVSCKYGKSKRRFFNTASGKKIKAIIKVPQPMFRSNGKVKAKIKSYKKRSFWGWRRWRTNIAAGARGNVYDTRCDNTPFYIDQWTSTKRRKKRIYIWDNPYYVSHIVKNGGMTGLYKQNGIVKELALTW